MKSKIVLALLSAFVSFGALADTKISALPAGTTLGGTEPIPMVQSAATVATTPAAILTYLNANSRAFSGDCTTPGGSGVLTCTKTNGVTFAPIATSGSASDLTAGTVAAARGGAGTVNGALKGNGSGAVSQAACADLSNAAASCSTDATNANNISAGTLPAGRVPAQTGDTVSSAGSTATTTQLLHPTDNTYTANHTVTATEEIVTCNSSGPLTMTLPAAIGTQKHYWFKNINTGTCTIARAGSDTIDGATSVALSTQYNTAEVEDRAAGAWDRLAQPVMGGDSSGTPSNTTNLKLNGNTPGGTCTNQVVTSLSTSAVPSCTTVTSSYLATNTVANSNLAQMPANTIKGNNTGSTANAADLTVAQIQTLLGMPGVVDKQEFTSSGTWTKPANVGGNAPLQTRVICIGPGGGAGSGAQVVLGTAESGGGAGGGGAFVDETFPTSLLPSTVAVTIGAAGTGGAVASGVGAGNNGTAGGNSTFGTLVTARGGCFGAGGQSAANSGGGGGAGFLSCGNASGATGGTGGAVGGGGGGSGGTSVSISSPFGGSGGGGDTSGAAGSNGNATGLGGPGGGAGGGLNTTTAFAGGLGGASNGSSNTSGGAATGAAGGNGVAPTGYMAGTAGGGGGGNAAGAGGTGGTGAQGAGGGGGGASAGGNSGAGGAGGGSLCVATSFF